ncbi:MAG: hypothetical protein LBJ00_12050 [Planctomycetaceae bacterium]|nr:hypothetical protein [Planctomycetaceae bacterium]
MNNRFTLLSLPNALCCRFTAASGILKQLEHKHNAQTGTPRLHTKGGNYTVAQR